MVFLSFSFRFKIKPATSFLSSNQFIRGSDIAVLGKASGGRQLSRPGGGHTSSSLRDEQMPRNLPHYCSSVWPKIKSAIFKYCSKNREFGLNPPVGVSIFKLCTGKLSREVAILL